MPQRHGPGPAPGREGCPAATRARSRGTWRGPARKCSHSPRVRLRRSPSPPVRAAPRAWPSRDTAPACDDHRKDHPQHAERISHGIPQSRQRAQPLRVPRAVCLNATWAAPDSACWSSPGEQPYRHRHRHVHVASDQHRQHRPAEHQPRRQQVKGSPLFLAAMAETQGQPARQHNTRTEPVPDPRTKSRISGPTFSRVAPRRCP